MKEDRGINWVYVLVFFAMLFWEFRLCLVHCASLYGSVTILFYTFIDIVSVDVDCCFIFSTGNMPLNATN
jgi:hypothetical protein